MLRADIAWTNNLQTVIENAEIEVRFIGDALDKASVAASNGFFRSVDTTLRWDSQTDENLRSITPGKSGNVSFGFASLPKSSSVMTALRNPEMILEVTIRGQRISESNVPEKLESTATTKVVINTDGSITPRLTRIAGPFINTGPIPPQVDKETTYTVTWSLTNTTNELSDAQVTATLPTYVRWMNIIDPTSESIEFHEIGGIVVWNVGTLKAGVGINSPPREISFQVALTPSISQVAKDAEMTGAAVLEGRDRFTGEGLRFSSRGLTTRLTSEPNFKTADGIIVP